MNPDTELTRSEARLLLAADTTPRSLRAIQERAGYSPDGGRPYYREQAERLAEVGLLRTHPPGRRMSRARYSRTPAGTGLVPAVLAAYPVLAPLTPVNPTTGRPAPIPGELSDPQARLLLALAAEGGEATLYRLLARAGYGGAPTAWFQARLMELTARFLAAAELNLDAENDAARRYRITPLGYSLADEITTGRPAHTDSEGAPYDQHSPARARPAAAAAGRRRRVA